MAQGSTIEWTQSTWNPVTGCTKVSPGCKFCYAERMANRLRAMGAERYANGFRLAMHPQVLSEPLGWRRPRRIFVCSMSDLFHTNTPDEWIARVFGVMERADWHTFQVLTKRPERAAAMAGELPWPPNVWLGVSAEDQRRADERIPPLLRCPAEVRFVSVEPLLGPIHRLPLAGIDWVICGGESGPGARSMDPDWARSARDQCAAAGVPFFFKQWGGPNKKKAGRLLAGRTWDQMPRSAWDEPVARGNLLSRSAEASSNVQ